MFDYAQLRKEVEKLAVNKSEYEWDELEELINDVFFDEIISSEQFDELMGMLMEIEPV